MSNQPMSLPLKNSLSLASIALTLLLFSNANCYLGPVDSPPGKTWTLGSSGSVWIPNGVQRVRGIYLEQGDVSVDAVDVEGVRNPNVLAYMWDFARVTFNPEAMSAAELADFKKFFQNAASTSGHPELQNLPLLWSYGRWLEPKLAPQVKDRIASALLFDGFAAQRILTKNGIGVYYVYECGHETMIPGMADNAYALRKEGYGINYFPVWSWTRGLFHGKDYVWPLWDWIATNQFPKSVPADGKVALPNLNISSGWLGDPSSWNNEWPKVSSYANFSGDKNKASWIPNEELAWVWRATVAKDAVKKNKETTWGVMRAGTHGDNTQGCSSPPQLGFTAGLTQNRVDHYAPPLIPKDTTLTLSFSSSYPDIVEYRIYEGTRLVATTKPNLFNIYKAQVKFPNSGVRSVTLQVTDTKGKNYTSWPAIVFVDPKKTDAGKVGIREGFLDPKSQGPGLLENKGNIFLNPGMIHRRENDNDDLKIKIIDALGRDL